MAWKQYILQKKQISTDAGITWHDAEPYVTRVGDPVAIFDTYEECMNMLYRWIPTDIEYCDYDVTLTTKAIFSTDANLYVNPEDEGLKQYAVYHYGIEKNGTTDDLYLTQEETSQFTKSEIIDSTIFDGVKEIGENAFSGFTELSAITLPSTLTTIGNYAFYQCSGLTSIVIPDSVTSIGNNAFWRCYGLTRINIPNSITKISQSTFSSCSGLTRITIPDSVTNIEGAAFWNCSLYSLNIPDSVKTIGNNAFSNNKFEDFTIGSGVTSIGSYAFTKNSGYLGDITIKAPTPPSISLDEYSRPFGNKTGYLRFFVPADSVVAYQQAWPYYAEKINPIQ